MTSFAKVCMDLSNNLRNLRFSKSSIIANNVNDVTHESNEKSIAQETKVNTAKPPRSPILQFRSAHHHKRPAPSVPETVEDPNQSSKFASITNSTPATVPANNHANTHSNSNKGPVVMESVSVSKANTLVSKSSDQTENTKETVIPLCPNRTTAPQKPRNGLNGPNVCAKSPTPTQRLPNKLVCSPIMAHRIATLTRNSQYNYEGNAVSAVTDSKCSSPILSCRGTTVATIKQRLLNQGLKIDLNGPVMKRVCNTRYRDYVRRTQRRRPISIDAMWQDETLMLQICHNLSGRSLMQMCAVCKRWCQLIYAVGFLDRVSLQLNVRQLVDEVYPTLRNSLSLDRPAAESVNTISENDKPQKSNSGLEQKIIERLEVAIRRGIRTLSIVQLADRYTQFVLNALMHTMSSVKVANQLSDLQTPSLIKGETSLCKSHQTTELRHPFSPVQPFVSTNPTHPIDTNACSTQLNNSPESSYFFSSFKSSHITGTIDSNNSEHTAHTFHRLILRCCSIVDSNLDQLIRLFPGLEALQLQCCNELSELVFWTCLSPSIIELSVFDCINVSDESISAIAQLLPQLKQLSLQAYHVTDAAFTYFSAKQRDTLTKVSLVQCMDVTNQGIMNLACALPGLRSLSLSGCSNLTDDGLDVVCEHVKQLRSLDLAWCARITDSGLECVACDLNLLHKLVLDRCTALTDIGIGHLTSMSKLRHLSLRWCVNLTDGTIAHLLGMTALKFLSLAGCKRLTEEGLCQLARHPRLRHIELTHCPGATGRVKAYLHENLAQCQLLD